MTILKQVSNKKEANKLISSCYNADKSGGLFNHGKNTFGFSGSVITATANKNNEGFKVEVTSGYHTESSLEEIVNGK